MFGSFTPKNVNNFIQELLDGKGRLEPLKIDMKFKTTEKWDRTDAPVITEESAGEVTDEGTVVQEEL